MFRLVLEILDWMLFKYYLISASSGKKLPAGTTIVIATYKLHRRPDVYPNPDKFDPDNFLPERSANRHYYAFVPFSAGPRSCVGEYFTLSFNYSNNIIKQFLIKYYFQVANMPCWNWRSSYLRSSGISALSLTSQNPISNCKPTSS